MDYTKEASRLFRAGYNCAQAVFCAFRDKTGLDEKTAARISSVFGGGVGRMREICGALTGALMVMSFLEGYDDPENRGAKKACYTRVQKLSHAFAGEMGSHLCRELLGVEGCQAPEPAVRDEAYYQSRPCERCCMCAARLLAAEMGWEERP